MSTLADRIRNEPVLILTAILAVLHRYLSPEDVAVAAQILEVAAYLGLGVVVRSQVTPVRKT